jgi:hypothetical protein
MVRENGLVVVILLLRDCRTGVEVESWLAFGTKDCRCSTVDLQRMKLRTLKVGELAAKPLGT